MKMAFLCIVLAGLALAGSHPALADVYVLGGTGLGATSTNVVCQYASDGGFIRSFPVLSGTIPTIALGPSGQVFVGAGGTVAEYSPGGVYVRDVVTGLTNVLNDNISKTYLDSQGSLYVTAMDYQSANRSMVRYNQDGVLQATYTGLTFTAGIAVDDHQNVYTAGASTTDTDFRRYNAAGGAAAAQSTWSHSSHEISIDTKAKLIYAAGNDFIYTHDLSGALLGSFPISPSRLADSCQFDYQSSHVLVGFGFADQMLSPGMVKEYDLTGNLVRQYSGHGIVAVYDVASSIRPNGGDANVDGRVDVVDLGILAKNYDGHFSGTEMALNALGDFTGDGNVDVVDLGILAKDYDWVGVWSPSGGQAAPEPASLMALALAGAALRRRRSQKT